MQELQLISKESAFEKYRNPELGNILISYLTEIKKSYDINDIAILEQDNQHKTTYNFWVGYISSTIKKILGTTGQDISNMSSNMPVASANKLIYTIPTFTMTEHLLFIDHQDARRIDSLKEYSQLLICRISKLLEHHTILDQLVGLEMDIYLKAYVAICAHELQNRVFALDNRLALIRELIHRNKYEELDKSIKAAQLGLHGIGEPMRHLRGPFDYSYKFEAINSIIDAVSSYISMLGRENSNQILRVNTDMDISGFEVCGIAQFVLITLVQNSYEAYRRSDHTLRNMRIRLQIRLDAINNVVQFIIKDNGPGIPSSIKDRIFDQIFSTKDRSSGLGLYLSKQLTKAIGGDIFLKAARTNSGAAFQLNLPYRK